MRRKGCLDPERFWEAAVSLLFPRRCPVCGAIVMPKGRLICPGCLKKLSFTKPPFCKKCGKEIASPEAEFCQDCEGHKRSFESGLALLNYTEAAARSMAAVKYKNRREYLDFYAEAAVLRFRRQFLAMGADALIPVPIHSSRRRARGFNQAEELADRMGKRLLLPVEKGLLKRVRKTDPQKNLGFSGRMRNLSQAFQAGQAPPWMKTVILVDDIYTTGSTAESCARALLAAGVKKVYIFAICIGHGV